MNGFDKAPIGAENPQSLQKSTNGVAGPELRETLGTDMNTLSDFMKTNFGSLKAYIENKTKNNDDLLYPTFLFFKENPNMGRLYNEMVNQNENNQDLWYYIEDTIIRFLLENPEHMTKNWIIEIINILDFSRCCTALELYAENRKSIDAEICTSFLNKLYNSSKEGDKTSLTMLFNNNVKLLQQLINSLGMEKVQQYFFDLLDMLFQGLSEEGDMTKNDLINAMRNFINNRIDLNKYLSNNGVVEIYIKMLLKFYGVKDEYKLDGVEKKISEALDKANSLGKGIFDKLIESKNENILMSLMNNISKFNGELDESDYGKLYDELNIIGKYAITAEEPNRYVQGVQVQKTKEGIMLLVKNIDIRLPYIDKNPENKEILKKYLRLNGMRDIIIKKGAQLGINVDDTIGELKDNNLYSIIVTNFDDLFKNDKKIHFNDILNWFVEKKVPKYLMTDLITNHKEIDIDDEIFQKVVNYMKK